MKIRKGLKYLVAEDETYPLPEWFPLQFRVDKYKSDYVELTETHLTLKRGFAWNGANACPDFKWIMVPSSIHDAMLWVLFYNSHVEVEPGVWFRDQGMMSEDSYREMKHAVDQWFADECRKRTRFAVTPAIMYIATNRASKILPGKDQAEAHKVVEIF